MPPITAVLRKISPVLGREDLRLNGLLLGAILLYAAGVHAVAFQVGLDAHLSYSLYTGTFGTAAVLSFALLFGIYVAQLAIVRREPRPLRVIARDLGAIIGNPATGINILLPLAILPLFLSAFTSFKSMIPEVRPFSFDPLLSSLDSTLHGGQAPWELTHALFGSPGLTVAINAAYNFWFFLMWVFVFAQLIRVKTAVQRRDRMQFFVTFVLTWGMIGSVLAFLLSSAGPCYFGRIVTDMADPYAPLFTRLRAIDQAFDAAGSYWGVWALGTQQTLWELYQGSETHIGSGISAMPSMHVAIATLMALAAFRIRRWLGWVMAGYAAIIQIGSVHLGWHYALDGYLSVLLTILLWRLAGWLVTRAAGSAIGPATGNGNV